MEARHTPGKEIAAAARIELKRDALGSIYYDARRNCVTRDSAQAARGAGALARFLARREARALRRLAGGPTCPRLLAMTATKLTRSYLSGTPLYAATFDAREYFRDALRQLRRMHACQVVHNDLAKEANWICMARNSAGIIDFQIAICFAKRGRIFKALAREDLRHLLKHKQHYADELLTQRQRAILARPLFPARLWRRGFKPIYRFVTRRIMGWPERDSAIERSV